MVVPENHKKLLLNAVPRKYRARLQQAIDLAELHYAGTTRWSGEPLLSHVLRSARYYAELNVDFNGVIATLLHHRLPQKAYENNEVFDDDVRLLLQNVEEVFSQAKKEESDTRTLLKYILSFRDDIRIVLIKLSEKFDNARTIDLLPEEKRLRVSRRLLEIYTPLAEFMNLEEAKREFSLHGFRVLHPEEYSEIAEWVNQKQRDIDQKRQIIIEVLKEILSVVSIEGSVWGRVKSFYSIWKKQFKHAREGKNAALDRFNDLIAYTIMVETVDQCYAVAYALKDYAQVADEDFEDYIKNPKPNGFSEIQLVCHFPEQVNINVEVQILTREMYWHNTYGPASHIAYKLAGKRHANVSTEFQWVELVHRELENHKKNADLPISRPMRLSLFSESVFVFTPGNKVIELPQGATAIDFAFAVHSGIGNSASFARINGRQELLSKVLNTGDVIEIITDPKKVYPSESLLAVAKTKSAQSKIRSGLRRKMTIGRG